MPPVAVIGICLSLFVSFFTCAEGNYVELDTWGHEYCRPIYCGIMSPDGVIKCCERRKTCCAYAEMAIGRTRDPFYYEMEKARLPTTTTTTTTTPRPLPTPSPRKTEDLAEDLGGPLEALPPPSAEAPGSRLHGGRPANLLLPSRDQVKPVTLEDNGWPNSGYLPKKPSKNDVTYHLPPLHPDIQKIRMDEHERESCRPKFCGVMSVSQWYDCCSRYKHCCAYVTYHSYKGNPFGSETDSNPFHFEADSPVY